MTSSDRRRDPRFPITRPVKLQCLTTGRYYGGHTRDVSSSGIMAQLSNPSLMVPGQRVKVAIAEHEREAIISADRLFPATIVRSLGMNGEQHVALQFDERQALAASA